MLGLTVIRKATSCFLSDSHSCLILYLVLRSMDTSALTLAGWFSPNLGLATCNTIIQVSVHLHSNLFTEQVIYYLISFTITDIYTHCFNKINNAGWQDSSVIEPLPNATTICGSSLCHVVKVSSSLTRNKMITILEF